MRSCETETKTERPSALSLRASKIYLNPTFQGLCMFNEAALKGNALYWTRLKMFSAYIMIVCEVCGDDFLAAWFYYLCVFQMSLQ